MDVDAHLFMSFPRVAGNHHGRQGIRDQIDVVSAGHAYAALTWNPAHNLVLS